ncbi:MULTISPECIES: hypothetical protein [unclassified Mesorhizobium]|uniref:hypothetical protein n=1 Tax=unclassified Mesorhizobium TaxID=325217 RepID=UPI00142EF4E1|nr:MULTISPECIES: hypothetical protein [unclassified Mesorhizobium]
MLTTADKFFVAILFLGANIARSHYGLDFGLDNDMAAALVQGVGAAFIWFVPNKGA